MLSSTLISTMPITRAARLVVTLIALQVLLSACGHQTLRTDKPSQASVLWQDHETQMLAISRWHIKGKLGYKSVSKAGSAGMDWCREPDQFKLLLSGPLGTGTVQIFGSDHIVTLRQANTPDVSASSAAALSRELLGWRLPVDELSYWIRGIPAPRALIGEQGFDEQGLLANLQQQGWQLVFSKYRQTDAGKLPGKIVAMQDKTRFTLIIKEHLFDSHSDAPANGNACKHD